MRKKDSLVPNYQLTSRHSCLQIGTLFSIIQIVLGSLYEHDDYFVIARLLPHGRTHSAQATLNTHSPQHHLSDQMNH